MATPTAVPLNAEPAHPKERKKQCLSPKSYADAVEEEPPTDGPNGSKDANGSNCASKMNGVNGAGNDGSKQTGHNASVLRIVDTGAPGTKAKQAERPELERQESKHEYSATVGSPFTFPRLTSTDYCKRVSTIPRELPLDTNTVRLGPEAAMDHKIS
jgi:2-acylglycerol O-acyltransferase 2